MEDILMEITSCRLCGRIVGKEGTKICWNCMKRLDEAYSDIHNYMRDNPHDDFDIESLSEDLDINPADIQMLIEMGYLDREIEEKSKSAEDRQKLAERLMKELEDMKSKRFITYGGEKYARGSNNEKRYVFDKQGGSNRKK